MTLTSPLLRNAKLQTECISIDQLTPMPGAPRQHPKSQIQSLIKSFEAFGQVLPILTDGECRIISGHGQWEAAKRLGMTEVMVIRVEHLDEVRVKALMLALNRLGDLSKWDDEALNTILLDLHYMDLDFDIEATGFSGIEIELRIEGLGGGLDDDDHVVVGDGPAITQPGDVWQLGPHRLICGNALEQASWAMLMGDERALWIGVQKGPR